MFVDEANIEVRAGRGGDGVTSFRREKYVARGGPDGGDGGRGGDVIFVASHNHHTLSDFRHVRQIKAENGRPGEGQNRTGASGAQKLVQIPVGTLVYDADTGELLADLVEADQRFVVAKGGDGGRGNTRFKSATNRAPRKSTPGYPGEERSLRLELKLIADVGLVGFPSVGKSTIISVLSSARPRIAAYPFTTLAPNLGVVKWTAHEEFTIADIPGLIEGAHEGKGLGVQFLRHVERTNLLVHVLEVLSEEEAEASGRDPVEDFKVIQNELKNYNPALLELPAMICLNKIDLPYVAAREAELRAHFEGDLGLPFVAISAAAGQNMEGFTKALGRAVKEGGFEALGGDPWER